MLRSITSRALSFAGRAIHTGSLRPSLLPRYPLYLANKPIQPNAALEVIDKHTGQVATRVALADKEIMEQAVQKAVSAVPKCAAMGSYERKDVLEKIVKQLKERSEELAIALTIEAGKPIRDSRGEVTRAIETFQIAAEESVRLYGEYAPLDISARTKGYSSVVKRFPVGVCSFITPFNFPINLVAHKVAPAIAAGCPFVLKPAPRTPIGALLLGDMLSKTDLPEGAFSIVPADIPTADQLVTDDRIRLLSFTGSCDVGWDMKRRAGKKRVVLELGGNAACIVDRTADIPLAVSRIIIGAFYQSGQSCISVQRIIAHAAIYDELKRRLVEETKKLVVGDPIYDNTFIGPLISEGDAQRVAQWVDEAVKDGANVIVGGNRRGVFYEPTIVENVPRSARLYSKEVFGPVCTLGKYGTSAGTHSDDNEGFKAAVEEVNASQFGLQAGVFTRDWDRAWYAFNNIEAGGVVVNDIPSFRVDSMPYGGVKDSGLGREGIRYAMEDMTERRIMVMRNAGAL